MFEQLFKHSFALARQRNGPLAEERHRYLVHCAQQQVARATLRGIANYLLVIATTLRLAVRPGQCISRAEVEAVADRWANRQPKPPSLRDIRGSGLRFIRAAIGWLTFLGRFQPLTTMPQPYAEFVEQFTDFMLRERGLSPCTAAYRSRTIHRFLEQIGATGQRLSTLTAVQVDELLARKVQECGYARITIKTWLSTLRSFFRFAERHEWCRPGLADAITAPHVYKHESLPLGPCWDDVKRVIASVQGNQPDDIRDRALLMLLAVYGLRAGEVAGLSLKDFDWEQETLTVMHGKGHKPRIYPLCRPVGAAVHRYLREVRPRSHRREVLLTLRAPFRALSAVALGQAVSRRLHALGLILPHYGPHALRHACATHLLEQGLSLKEISDHLGHQSPESTRIYAKVDLIGLRTVGEFALEDLL